MDAAASRRARMRAGRMMLKRTAKSCGSDAPMLASSLREEAQATVSNKPGHRGDHEVSRKTIARGMPGLLRCTCGDYARVLCFISHARLWVHWAPGIPCALCSQRRERFLQNLGRLAPRERGLMAFCFFKSESIHVVPGKRSATRDPYRVVHSIGRASVGWAKAPFAPCPPFVPEIEIWWARFA